MSTHTHHHDSLVPRGPLMAAGALVLGALLVVSAVRFSGMEIHQPDAPAVVTRELRFEDKPDGSIAVIDVRQQRQIESITGEAGFVRGTLRGLARERRRSGLGPEPSFQLIGRADGRLTLQDPATGRHVDLESFGPTNASAFAKLLRANPA